MDGVFKRSFVGSLWNFSRELKKLWEVLKKLSTISFYEFKTIEKYKSL